MATKTNGRRGAKTARLGLRLDEQTAKRLQVASVMLGVSIGDLVAEMTNARFKGMRVAMPGVGGESEDSGDSTAPAGLSTTNAA